MECVQGKKSCSYCVKLTSSWREIIPSSKRLGFKRYHWNIESRVMLACSKIRASCSNLPRCAQRQLVPCSCLEYSKRSFSGSSFVPSFPPLSTSSYHHLDFKYMSLSFKLHSTDSNSSLTLLLTFNVKKQSRNDQRIRNAFHRH